MLKIGVDTYCFHHLFGEVYDDQEKQKENMTIEEFLKFSKSLNADGVSLQTCFLPSEDEGYLRELGVQLDDYGFEKRIFAWGHPSGLDGGKNEAMFENLKIMIPRTKLIGTNVMRVAGSGYAFHREDHKEQVKSLIRMFKEATKIAEDNDIKLAVENHNDFSIDEFAEIIETVDSPNLGVTFDTANWIRVLEDPIKCAKRLASRIFAVHLKDCIIDPMQDPDSWVFFSSVPAGTGLVKVEEFMRTLQEINYDGLLAIEFDKYVPQWENLEKEAVAVSFKNLKRIAKKIDSEI